RLARRPARVHQDAGGQFSATQRPENPGGNSAGPRWQIAMVAGRRRIDRENARAGAGRTRRGAEDHRLETQLMKILTFFLWSTLAPTIAFGQMIVSPTNPPVVAYGQVAAKP